MSLCINPYCPQSENPENLLFCQGCGSELLLNGRYRVVKLLGSGGFGKTFEVSECASRTLGEPSCTPKVLKVLIKNHPKTVELFQREAAVLSQLHHPGIPEVEPDGYFVYWFRDAKEPLHCLVMEKIEGLNLHQYLQRRGNRPIEQKLALRWLQELVTILQQVHNQNVFHRDIKPSNIMLRVNGELALIDFGTARQLTETYIAKQAIGQITGVVSAGYTPPEQVHGQAVQQSDFFALGRTFVYLLTAKDPSLFYDPQRDEIHWRDRSLGDAEGNHAPAVSPLFADFIDKLMARLPSQRPQSAEEILQQLEEMSGTLYPTQVVPPKSRQASSFSKLTPISLKLISKAGWRFWVQWVLTNIVGWSGGAILGWIGGTVVYQSVRSHFMALTIFGFAVGASVGIMQWLVLRRRVYRAGWWVLATATGSAVGAAVGSVFGTSIGAALLGVVSVAIMQWLVLRRQVYRAGWWMLITVVGLIVALALGKVLGLPLVSFWSVVMGLPVFGAITGSVLVWLLQQQPVSEA